MKRIPHETGFLTGRPNASVSGLAADTANAAKKLAEGTGTAIKETGKAIQSAIAKGMDNLAAPRNPMIKQMGAIGDLNKTAREAGVDTAQGESLFRGMTAGLNGPVAGPSARTLGARPNTDIPVDCNGCVHPGTGGMSVAPQTPMNLPSHRRPPDFGGTGKDPVWSINSDNLGPDLIYVQDKATHGTIQPSRSMTLEQYQNALSNTIWDKQ